MGTTGVKLKPINRENVVDKVVKRIVDSIMQGTFKAGDKLPNEYELIENLGVSRNSLREAMKILEAMGIVEIRIGDGTYVCSEASPAMVDPAVYSILSSLSNNSELIDFRQYIDESIVQTAITMITDEEIQALKENVAQTAKALEEMQFDRVQELDVAFHYMLIDSAKNLYYSKMMKELYKIFIHYIFQTISNDRIENGHKSNIVEYHQAILNVVVERNPAKVRDAVALSLNRHYDFVE